LATCSGSAGYRRTAADGAEIFRAALKEPIFAQKMGFGAAQSFAATVVDLADPSTEELDEAVKLLGPTLDNGKSDRELASTLGKLLRDEPAAAPPRQMAGGQRGGAARGLACAAAVQRLLLGGRIRRRFHPKAQKQKKNARRWSD
jgi:hypothetical protein